MMIITLCFFLKSCSLDQNNNNDFLIKVDSIHVADTLASAVPFDIEFYGTVGLNGCANFKHSANPLPKTKSQSGPGVLTKILMGHVRLS